MIRHAIISPCGKFRYRLDRTWDKVLPMAVFIMLNPSTADEFLDDNTIRKIVKFAKRLGFGSIEVVNLWAYRTSSPAELRLAGWPAGPDCDKHIIQSLMRASAVICGWGMNARQRPDRVAEVLDLIDIFSPAPPMALRLSADGTPWHPLYLPDDAELGTL